MQDLWLPCKLQSQFKLKAPVNNVQDSQFHMAVLRDIKGNTKEIKIPCDMISVIQKRLGST